MIITNLLTNMVVLTLHGFIPTNTPALKEYALHVAFTNAESLAVRWHLDKDLITSNKVSAFSVRASPRQVHANIEFADRYLFGTTTNGFVVFSDETFRAAAMFPEFMASKELAERYGTSLKKWLTATNALTLDGAQRVAESAMRSYGVLTNQMDFVQPKTREQLNLGGRPVPYYKFEWASAKGYCKVHVSGIVTNIVHFEFQGPDDLRLKPPSNYLELLGLPSNTIFVKPLPSGTFEIYEK